MEKEKVVSIKKDIGIELEKLSRLISKTLAPLESTKGITMSLTVRYLIFSEMRIRFRILIRMDIWIRD